MAVDPSFQAGFLEKHEKRGHREVQTNWQSQMQSIGTQHPNAEVPGVPADHLGAPGEPHPLQASRAVLLTGSRLVSGTLRLCV